MIFEKINYNHIEDVSRIALAQYKEECSSVPELPTKDYTDLFAKMISKMINNNLGIVAIDEGEVVGFITCYGPINGFFGKEKGIFSPIHGHGTIKENRERIYSLLYQNAAKVWTQQEIYTHAIAVYAHDNTTISTFFQNGFGMRCVDAITSVNNDQITYESNPSVDIREITIDEIDNLLDLKNSLIAHLNNSPIFMPVKPFDSAKFREQSIKRNSRFFTASKDNKVIGYIEIMSEGENFTCDDKETTNICGAYLYPEYRGTGIFRDLLAFVMESLKNENYKRCGVDFESINPNANKFWLKYFKPYTYSLVRRIDERINL